jgi:hypothetical protein
MADMVAAGIFNKDEKKGLPLRKVLRKLEEENELAQIPSVHIEKNGENKYLYFVKEGEKFEHKDSTYKKSTKVKTEREDTDEYYLINICNEVLNEKALVQHTFDTLVGDLHKNGKSKTNIPLDAYYEIRNLVIEFIEVPNAESDALIEKSKRITASGITRAEQRIKYNKRKRTFLNNKRINVVDIEFAFFDCSQDYKLIRNKEKDTAIIKEILEEYIESDSSKDKKQEQEEKED